MKRKYSFLNTLSIVVFCVFGMSIIDSYEGRASPVPPSSDSLVNANLALAASMNNLTSAIQTLNGHMGDLQTIATLQDAIEGLNDQLNQVKETMSAYEPDLQLLVQMGNDLTQALEQMQALAQENLPDLTSSLNQTADHLGHLADAVSLIEANYVQIACVAAGVLTIGIASGMMTGNFLYREGRQCVVFARTTFPKRCVDRFSEWKNAKSSSTLTTVHSPLDDV